MLGLVRRGNSGGRRPRRSWPGEPPAACGAAEQLVFGAGASECDADPRGGFSDAPGDLEQAQPQGVELGRGEWLRLGDGVVHGPQATRPDPPGSGGSGRRSPGTSRQDGRVVHGRDGQYAAVRALGRHVQAVAGPGERHLWPEAAAGAEHGVRVATEPKVRFSETLQLRQLLSLR